MPFTFSHPAVVLPLTFVDKRKFSVTALTIGSLTPDFEYFFRLIPVSVHSHKMLGIFWYDLPLSIVLFYLYNLVVKDELIDNLPLFLRKRFFRFKALKRIKYSGQNYLIIFTSLLIGITSHVLWDKLTHKTVQLLEDIVESYSLVWNTSSVVGGLVIAFIIWKMPKTLVPVQRVSFPFWFIILSTVLTFIIIRSASQPDLAFMVIAAISGLFTGLLVASLLNKIRHYNMPKKRQVVKEQEVFG